MWNGACEIKMYESFLRRIYVLLFFIIRNIKRKPKPSQFILLMMWTCFFSIFTRPEWVATERLTSIQLDSFALCKQMTSASAFLPFRPGKTTTEGTSVYDWRLGCTVNSTKGLIKIYKSPAILLKRKRKNSLEKIPGTPKNWKLSVPPQLIAIHREFSPASTPSRGYTIYGLANHHSHVYSRQ